ncbi:MAG: glycosyltransferase family 2 protein [Candidatus Eisenbacteria bacterium]|nr:glycosyltransferase family 2 protein [Candidatus Eisenbacteria bacterium]
MPAFNAEATLERTFRDIPEGVVDEIILTDDGSADRTAEIAGRLGMVVLRHQENRGYGANQKTCYDAALARGATVVVMIHPDYQYDPRVIPFAVGFLDTGICDVVIGSRIRTRRETLDSGMPAWKYVSNRALTFIENLLLGQNLGDFHSGFRVFRREVLETIDYRGNSDDFVFDTQVLAQAVFFGFRIGDVPIPSRYFPEASSIGFRRSVTYGLQTLGVMGSFLLHRAGWIRSPLFRRAVAAGASSPISS